MITFDKERKTMKRIFLLFALLFCFFDGYNQDIDFLENRIEYLSLTPWDSSDSILYYSEILLKLDPINETAIKNYIFIMSVEGKDTKLSHFLDDLIFQDSTNAQLYVHRGFHILSTSSDTSCFSDFEWALKSDSVVPLLLYTIGMNLSYVADDKHDSLFNYLRYNIEEYPPSTIKRLHWAKTQYEVEANRYLEKTIEKDPASFDAVKNSLIIIYKRQGRFAEADSLENIKQAFITDKSYMPTSPLQLYFPQTFFLDTVNVYDNNPKDSVFYEKRLLTAGGRNSYYSSQLYEFREPLLVDINDHEIFRFLWLRSFHEPVVIKFEKHNDKQYLIRKVREGVSGYRAGNIIINDTLMISDSQWAVFDSVLSNSGFWETATIEKRAGLIDDGAHWILEGKVNDHYHVVDRHSPSWQNSPRFWELCFFIIELSQLGCDKDEIY